MFCAALVPEDFDFATHAVARAYFGGATIETHCRDEALSWSPDEHQRIRAEQAQHLREHREGPAARWVEAAYRYDGAPAAREGCSIVTP